MDGAQEDTSTAIFDITHACLESFDRVVAEHDEPLLTKALESSDTTSARSQRQPTYDFLGLRNSFLFWIDYTGALSLTSSSLDTRLQGLADTSAMVIELLEMVLRNLHRIDHKPSNPSIVASSPTTFLATWDSALQAIETALDRLHFVAVAIRKASAKQLDHSVTTFLTDEDIVFRRDIASWIRYRFPAARRGLCQQLGDSIAIRRRMLLQTNRHAKRLAVRRVPGNMHSVKQHHVKDPNTKPLVNQKAHNRIVPHPRVLASGITKASRPDPNSPALKLLHLPKPRAPTTVMSSISTPQSDTFEYPPAPTGSGGEGQIRCPFCFMPLKRHERDEGNDHWKRHLDEHLKPYACLFPECAESLVFFTHRNQWKEHMKSIHPGDWLRKVHTIVWHCDIDHDPPEMFETELQWRKHMQDLQSHPQRKLAAPTQAQLDSLSPRKRQVALREELVCPLCEQVPERIRPLINQGQGDPADMHNVVVDHVADHLKSLSLMALPSLETTAPDNPGETGESVVMMQDSFRRLMNDNSVPQPPSGREHLDEISLPVTENWDINMTFFATMSSGSSVWDKDYINYTGPAEPPEASDQETQEWLEHWKSWKTENDHVSSKPDPILEDLIRSKVTNAARLSSQEPPWDEFNINAKDDTGRTQLSIVAETGDLATARLLLEKGAGLEKADRDGRTPLSWAASENHEAIVQLLLNRGADVNTADSSGQTPLLWAAKNGHKAVARTLLSHGAAIEAVDKIYKQTPLLWAAENGHETVVRTLISYRAAIEASDKNGLTPLSWAAKNGYEAVVRTLISYGAAIEAPDKTGRTPLLWAAENGHEAVARTLLSHGAAIEAVDKIYKQTPLLWAADNGHEAVVRTLISSGAGIEASDKNGLTPLSWAAKNGYEAVVRTLISHGAAIEAPDKTGRTPLLWAAEKGYEEVVKLLLEKGALLDSRDQQGQTALSFAAYRGHNNVVQLLRSQGAQEV